MADDHYDYLIANEKRKQARSHKNGVLWSQIILRITAIILFLGGILVFTSGDISGWIVIAFSILLGRISGYLDQKDWYFEVILLYLFLGGALFLPVNTIITGIIGLNFIVLLADEGTIKRHSGYQMETELKSMLRSFDSH